MFVILTTVTIQELTTPKLSRGRGAWLSVVAGSRDVGQSRSMDDGYTDTGLGQSPGCTPVSGFMREGPHTSTPGSDTHALTTSQTW